MSSTEDNITHVRWKIPDDVIKRITKHKKLLSVIHPDKEITQEQAAIDLMRKRKLPKTIVLEQ